MWLLVLIFVNWTVFATRSICIEMGLFCAKYMYITLFKYEKIAQEHQDAICLTTHAVRCAFHNCGCFMNFFLSYSICAGLAATKAEQPGYSHILCTVCTKVVIDNKLSPFCASL